MTRRRRKRKKEVEQVKVGKYEDEGGRGIQKGR